MDEQQVKPPSPRGGNRWWRAVRHTAWVMRAAYGSVGTLVVGLVVVAIAYGWGRAVVTESVYRDRLESMAHDYLELQNAYNRAVQRTAVTEIDVHDGRVDVVVRTCEGNAKRFPTTCDPDAEVYVDYVVVDGRLWIRRVFDDGTPPSRGTGIDPDLLGVDWEDPAVVCGKAVYRRLSPGRWIVTVTGNGSLGLVHAGRHDGPEQLAWAPPVQDFEKAVEELRTEVDEVGCGEAVVALWRRWRRAGM